VNLAAAQLFALGTAMNKLPVANKIASIIKIVHHPQITGVGSKGVGGETVCGG